MKYSLDLRLYAQDKTILEGIAQNLPLATDTRVWGVEYLNDIVMDEFKGMWCLNAQIRFNDTAGRDEVQAAIESLPSVFNDVEVGSVMRLHTCDHDTNPPQGCSEEVVWEVVP